MLSMRMSSSAASAGHGSEIHGADRGETAAQAAQLLRLWSGRIRCVGCPVFVSGHCLMADIFQSIKIGWPLQAHKLSCCLLELEGEGCAQLFSASATCHLSWSPWTKALRRVCGCPAVSTGDPLGSRTLDVSCWGNQFLYSLCLLNRFGTKNQESLRWLLWFSSPKKTKTKPG